MRGITGLIGAALGLSLVSPAWADKDKGQRLHGHKVFVTDRDRSAV